MRNTLKLLIALILALSLGIISANTSASFFLDLIKYIEPIGLLWIGFLKMVVIPLLISLLVTSVASKEKKMQASPLLRRTMFVFLALYTAILLLAFLLVPLFLQLLPSNFSISISENDTSVIAGTKPLSFLDQLISWVPENPFKSATEGAILPVIIFSLMLGLALNYVVEEQRKIVLNFFHAISAAMLKIVEWVLVFAPLGIFCILFPIANRVGARLVGVLGIYVFIHLAMYLIGIVVIYLITSVFTKMPLLTLVKAYFRPQLIALGTQSSIATMPAMINAAEKQLMISPKVTNVVLPLAVSIFKAGNCISKVIYVLFTARLYHIEIMGWQWFTLFVVSLAASVGSAGLPSGASFFAPVLTVFSAMGLPTQGIPILFAVDTIPDMACTATNVTADMSATTIVAKDKITKHLKDSLGEF